MERIAQFKRFVWSQNSTIPTVYLLIKFNSDEWRSARYIRFCNIKMILYYWNHPFVRRTPSKGFALKVFPQNNFPCGQPVLNKKKFSMCNNEFSSWVIISLFLLLIGTTSALFSIVLYLIIDLDNTTFKMQPQSTTWFCIFLWFIIIWNLDFLFNS